ncbi:MAG: DUF2784 domain-containing protein [Deltaproteobacteria bacterium]|nr:DUF2784 domain-containing protein [Deltaproteobacteria bacterium]MBW1927646.1 DUF2784 domain-containing protein [Deltaproteobacteria bacterium]MBW2026248.1 DUF2784 domain-containing protein [Deltaproteobacteria bacterium]MBW2127330.1 DUF2784 domain-containing protein [Deltaproteobacteria bacterium]RLB20523.1 MAG: DUF2784 domain-containing protein [Deltaproteobacteria bacterium]
MYYLIAANLLVVIHLGFVCFVVMGGFLVLRWRRIAFLHIPAAVWGAIIEYQGWLCPLTPLEQRLRQAAGQFGYSGGFIEHYLLPVLYPAYLSRELQIVLGTFVIVMNIAVYGWVIARLARSRK